MAGEHDARKVLGDLRDHLGRHDKPVAFLFGAGTSCAVLVPSPGDPATSVPIIPAVAGLTQLCRSDVQGLGNKYNDAWARIETDLQAIGQATHVENMLSRLRMMLGALGATDQLVGLTRAEIAQFEEQVRRTIARVVSPDLSLIPTTTPHRAFARWLSKTSRHTPIEVFTVNYDVLIEQSLEAERVPLFDGFVGSYQPFFNPDSLRRSDASPGPLWTRLWKMHGSVTWRRIEEDGRKRVVRGSPVESGEMIFPSFEKYDESRQQPYSAFSDRLSRFLDQEDALLVAVGYSFGDEHINNLVFGALENRNRTHAYALQFTEPPLDSDLIKRATQRPNMLVLGPDKGCIGGSHAPWIVDRASSSEDGAFVVSLPGATGAPAAQMKIGDFTVFARFLQMMTE